MTEAELDPDALAYNDMAEAYDRGRPGYEPAVVVDVLDWLDLGAGQVVVDLAAGTGKFTRELVVPGVTVLAVEPVREMAAFAAVALPGVVAVRAVASGLPLRSSSVDAMTVAQAFQWFGAVGVSEIARVLRPAAGLALIWNRRLGTGLWGAIDEVLEQHRTRRRRRTDAVALLDDSGAFSSPVVARRPWTRQVDRTELTDHISSLSWVGALPRQERSVVIDEVEQVIAGVDGPLRLAYEAETVFTRRR